MELLSIINIFFSIVFFIIITYLLQMMMNKNKKDNELKIKNELFKTSELNWKVKVMLILSILLILFSFVAPLLFTNISIIKYFDFTKTGQIGDTIGGIMNPFIAVSGVIVTGLAFYIQYKANLQQRELFYREQEDNKNQLQEQINNQNTQIKLQQFESQFYEMLRLHRENVNEMKIYGYDFTEDERGNVFKSDKVTEGRKVFVTMKTEFENILSFYKNINKKELNENSFEKCYHLFFSGLDEFEKTNKDDIMFRHLLHKARNKHLNLNMVRIAKRKEYDSVKMYYNYKPFSGHASRLAHYFRHLYLVVKSIVYSDIITDYDDKMKYLRILRAQLSNHEQFFLFYNWLGKHGFNWENDEQHFFTEYKMIHNLWYKELYDDPYIKNKVEYLRSKKVIFRNGNMFEVD